MSIIWRTNTIRCCIWSMARSVDGTGGRTRFDRSPHAVLQSAHELADRSVPLSVYANRGAGRRAGRHHLRHAGRVCGVAAHGLYRRCAVAHDSARAGHRLLSTANLFIGAIGAGRADRAWHRLAEPPARDPRRHRHWHSVHRHVCAGHPDDQHRAQFQRLYPHAVWLHPGCDRRPVGDHRRDRRRS